MSKSMRALAALLGFPSAELCAARHDIAFVLRSETLLSRARTAVLGRRVRLYLAGELAALQQRHDELFGIGGVVSLALFDNDTGENRDIGRARANLVALYAAHGLRITAGERPDRLPLFLEFLALLPQADADALLAEPAGILRQMSERLAVHDHFYSHVLGSLAELAQAARGVAGDADAGDDAEDEGALRDNVIRVDFDATLDRCGADRLRARLGARSVA